MELRMPEKLFAVACNTKEMIKNIRFYILIASNSHSQDIVLSGELYNSKTSHIDIEIRPNQIDQNQL